MVGLFAYFNDALMILLRTPVAENLLGAAYNYCTSVDHRELPTVVCTIKLRLLYVHHAKGTNT